MYDRAMPIVGLGIDLTEVSRISEMVIEHGDHFVERCFTAREADVGRGGRRWAEHLAARFAAKEAVLKALGTGLTGGISWTDIEIVVEATGRPTVVLRGAAAARAATLGVSSWHVSLTHTQTHAAAVVVAEST